MFRFATPRTRARPSLTPMIDVVFLLLVFFMLVARFGPDRALPLEIAGEGAYAGPPRLVEVFPAGLTLNGVALSQRDVLLELVRISASGTDTVVLRPAGGASLQRLVEVMALMDTAGFRNIAIAEARP